MASLKTCASNTCVFIPHFPQPPLSSHYPVVSLLPLFSMWIHWESGQETTFARWNALRTFCFKVVQLHQMQISKYTLTLYIYIWFYEHTRYLFLCQINKFTFLWQTKRYNSHSAERTIKDKKNPCLPCPMFESYLGFLIWLHRLPSDASLWFTCRTAIMLSVWH